MPDSKSKNTKWCLGIHCSANRLLSVEETAFLKRQLRVVRAIWISAAVASIALPLFVFTLFNLSSEVFLPELIGKLFTVVIIILILVGFPVLFLLTKDYLKQAGKLKKDIESGLVYCFEGVLDEKEMLPLRESSAKESEKQIFEILPCSEYLFSLNGSLVKSRCKLSITNAVSPPENPYAVSLPSNFLQSNIEHSANLSRRRLSSAEIKELENHAKQSRKLPKPALAFLIFSPLMASLGAALSDSFYKWLDEFKVPVAMSIPFSFFIVYSYIRRVLYARKFLEDVELGWVIIFRRQGEKNIENRQEILPVSSALWTDKGKPCEWRMQKNK